MKQCTVAKALEVFENSAEPLSNRDQRHVDKLDEQQNQHQKKDVYTSSKRSASFADATSATIAGGGGPMSKPSSMSASLSNSFMYQKNSM